MTPNDFNNRERDKLIDVTKPRDSSNVNTQRVSAYTAREQESLEKLKNSVGGKKARKSGGHFKTILAIVLILLLLGLIVAFFVLIGGDTPTEEAVYEIRLSMQIENKSILSVITETGQEQLREINPGDKIPLRAYVRNSTNYAGDAIDDTDNVPQAIFVRFKLLLILGYEERYDIMKPTMSDNWYKYDETIERKYSQSGEIVEDDHWYYYLGSIAFIQAEELFSAIEFDGNVITCEDGGKYGQIQVLVESTEADINSIYTRAIWPSAPEGWRRELSKRV